MTQHPLTNSARSNGGRLLLHFFEHDGEQYVFDARSFRAFRVTDCAREVLKRFGVFSDRALVRVLARRFSLATICDTLSETNSLVQSGRLTLYDLDTFGAPGFNRIVLLLTENCNLACKYCFEAGILNQAAGASMPTGVASAAVDYLLRYATERECTIQFYGGEPLLNWETLIHTLEYATARSSKCGKCVSFHCVTNGTLITKQIARVLHKFKVTVQISIDGDKKAHDAGRVSRSGHGSFDKVRACIRLLRNEGVNVCFLATIASHNHAVGAVLSALEAFGCSASFCLVASKTPGIGLSDEQWDKFHEEHARLLNRELKQVGTGLSSSMWQRHVATISQRLRGQDRLVYGCGAGLAEFTIGTRGEVFACQRLLDGSRGNIGDFMRGHVEPHVLWPGFLQDVDSQPVCRRCWAKYLCGGGCLHSVRCLTGTNDPPSEHCAVFRREAEAAIRETLTLARVRAD